MAKLSNLQDLLVEQLRDLYDAENQIMKALPKMAQQASAPELRQGFETHLSETKGHVQRLEQVFSSLNEKPGGHSCKAMQGIIKEGDELMKERADASVMDAGLIASAQRVEHYEMAGYGCVRTWANLLGMSNIAQLLQQTLDEEGATDQKLTAMAERIINVQAAEA